MKDGRTEGRKDRRQKGRTNPILQNHSGHHWGFKKNIRMTTFLVS